MNVRIFNVKYSPNLGDGLIAECLEQAITELSTRQDLKVSSIDLAGRVGFARGNAGRVVALKLLDRLSSPLRRAAVFFPSQYNLHNIWLPHYRQMSKAANAIIVGGGNLFSDADLNFPIKLNGALKIVSEANLPVAIYGVGVSENWTPKGIDLLRKGLKKSNIRYVSVRDHLSKIHFDHFFSEAAGMSADVVYDPALLISKFRPKIHSGSRPQVVGINITSAIAVRYHSTLKPTDEELAGWYIDLCRGMSAAGHSLALFTNGSPEDEAFLARLKPPMLAIPRLKICEISTPYELSDLISSFSLLIAHRMHSIVSAYSYQVPVVPLAWDVKIKSLLEMLSLQTTTYEAVKTAPAEIVNLVGPRIMTKDNFFENWQTILSKCYNGVAKVTEKLQIS
jgi:polysaccharide pyruvyl transferase WcaK-like protein